MNQRWVIIWLLLIANFWLWTYPARNHPSGLLTVALLDVGQGEAIYIETAAGRQALIDGGPGRKVLGELGAMMPAADRDLDVALVSNPDEDHLAGLVDVLERYQVGLVIEPGTRPQNAVYSFFEQAVKDGQSQKLLGRRGMTVRLDKDTSLEILFPVASVSGLATNDGSLVAKLVYDQTSFLLTGDATAKTENVLLKYDRDELDADVLKVAHHGSKTSTSKNFVAAVSPSVAVLSAGRRNRYGHPHQITLDTLAAAGARVSRTDLDGRIVMKSDGQHVWFE